MVKYDKEMAARLRKYVDTELHSYLNRPFSNGVRYPSFALGKPESLHNGGQSYSINLVGKREREKEKEKERNDVL